MDQSRHLVDDVTTILLYCRTNPRIQQLLDHCNYLIVT